MALLKAAGVLVVLRPSSFELLPIARARSKLGFFPGGVIGGGSGRRCFGGSRLLRWVLRRRYAGFQGLGCADEASTARSNESQGGMKIEKLAISKQNFNPKLLQSALHFVRRSGRIG